METLFIEAKFEGKINLSKINLKQLPKKIGLATTLQFVDKINEIKNYLEKNNKKIYVGKGKQKYNAQILGCDASSAEEVKDKVDCFLYVGDGQFHPIALGLLDKNVFVFNPLSNNFKKLDNNKIEKYKKRKKGALLKFLSSKNIGILISEKEGQKYSKLDQLENKYKDKKFYKFVFDTLDYNQLENFPFIECWVNTACPRIEEDIKVINVKDIE